MNRRDFFSSSIGTAAFAAFLGNRALAESVLAEMDQSGPQDKNDPFWNSFFDDVDPTKPHVVMRDAAQPVPEHVEASKTPRYFHFDDEKGIRYAENIDRSELPKIQGPVLVSISMSGFHASEEDQKRVASVSTAQLQLHAVQTTPIAEFIAPLAWASLASVFPSKSGKLPTVEQLNFLSEDGSGSSSSVSRILYPKAEGKFAVNVTLPPKDSILHKLISNGLKAAQMAAPLVSLPAISVPAIKAFTSFYNTLQQNAGFIINSPLKDAVASYAAVDSGNMHADALKLLTGQYIVVPSSSSDALGKQMPDYTMVNGYLVPRKMSGNQDPMTVAKASLTDITYATLKISVSPATNAVTAETPTGDPSTNSDDDAAAPTKPKPKAKKP